MSGLDELLEPAEPEREVMPGITTPASDVVRVETSGFTLELSLRQLLTTVQQEGRYLGYDPDEDEPRYAPASLMDLLVAEAGDKLVRHLRADLLKRLRDETSDVVVATISDVVREQLEVGVHTQTNHLGQPAGEPVPLVQLIRTVAQEQLTKTVGDQYGRGGRQTVLQKLVADEVTKAFKAELQAEVAAAREAARAAVRNSAAEVIQETIERATRGL